MPYSTKQIITETVLAFIVLAVFVMIAILAVRMAPAAAANIEADSSKWDSLKMTTITEMYTKDAANQYAQTPTLMSYADQNLQQAMILEQSYFDQHEMICGTGHDVMWDSQDPDYGQDKQISINAEGLVQVHLAQGSDIYYKLTCADDTCQVADVIINDNQSLKDFLNTNCL